MKKLINQIQIPFNGHQVRVGGLNLNSRDPRWNFASIYDAHLEVDGHEFVIPAVCQNCEITKHPALYSTQIAAVIDYRAFSRAKNKGISVVEIADGEDAVDSEYDEFSEMLRPFCEALGLTSVTDIPMHFLSVIEALLALEVEAAQ